MANWLIGCNSITKRSQSRSTRHEPEAGTHVETTEEHCLALPLGSRPVFFPIQPRSTCLGLAQLTVGRALLHQLATRQMPPQTCPRAIPTEAGPPMRFPLPKYIKPTTETSPSTGNDALPPPPYQNRPDKIPKAKLVSIKLRASSRTERKIGIIPPGGNDGLGLATRNLGMVGEKPSVISDSSGHHRFN